MQHFSDMEDFYRPAKMGDPCAYKALYNAFIDEGLVRYKSLCPSLLIYSITREDVELMLSELFIKVLSNYHRNHGKFVNYSEIAIDRAVKNYCVRELSKPTQFFLSLDSPSESGGTLIEEISANDYRSEALSLSLRDSIYKISSKSKSKNREEKKIGKVILYRLNGYSYPEICRKMKLTEGQLRFLLSKIREDEEFADLKIDLK